MHYQLLLSPSIDAVAITIVADHLVLLLTLLRTLILKLSSYLLTPLFLLMYWIGPWLTAPMMIPLLLIYSSLLMRTLVLDCKIFRILLTDLILRIL